MKRFSAQYVITNSGSPLKRAMITVGDDGEILKIEETGGYLSESHSVEFYNGVIIPGFVNCHTHLELSHLKDIFDEGRGLTDFLTDIRTNRDYKPDEILSSARTADTDLYNAGVDLCADICNTTITFDIKKTSHIRYINLIEVFGIEPSTAEKRIHETNKIAKTSAEAGLPYYIVPHSVYSVSLPLFRLLKKKMSDNLVSSIHFMESEDEKRFFSGIDNPLFRSYRESGLIQSDLQIPGGHLTAIMNEMTLSGNLILVHNTYADKETVNRINKRGNTYWCLCPRSNLFIAGLMPPVEMLIEENCNIVIGTDSLASNHDLSILRELKTIQKYFPAVNLKDLIRWATLNGAKALCEDKNYGRIETGIKPGLLLLENLDLNNFKLLPETTVSRLI